MSVVIQCQQELGGQHCFQPLLPDLLVRAARRAVQPALDLFHRHGVLHDRLVDGHFKPAGDHAYRAVIEHNLTPPAWAFGTGTGRRCHSRAGPWASPSRRSCDVENVLQSASDRYSSGPPVV